MSTVWLVWDDTDEYHPSLLEIHATEESARKAMEEARKLDVLGSTFAITEWTVNEDG